MKNIKAFLAGFIPFVYDEYIQEDWSVITKFGKIYCYWAWFVRAIFIWIVSPIFIPVYLYKKSDLYKQIQKIQASPEYQAQVMKTMSMFRF